jgi:thiol-disulfide isomerase/thioredoxin
VLSRRSMLAGMAGLAAAGPGFAADDASPVAHGVLAENPLALAFETAPSELPSVSVTGPDGTRGISSLYGRTLIMPLWAEWCPPCMGEIPDFARLQQKYGGAKFAIVPVLSGTHKQMTPDVIARMFGLLHADVFEPLIEYRLGAKLLEVMARRGRTVTLPCNLVIAPNGRVAGREFGLKGNENTPSGPGSRGELLSRAQAGDSLSLWGKHEGEEFATALANGFLA